MVLKVAGSEETEEEPGVRVSPSRAHPQRQLLSTRPRLLRPHHRPTAPRPGDQAFEGQSRPTPQHRLNSGLARVQGGPRLIHSFYELVFVQLYQVPGTVLDIWNPPVNH